MSLHVLRMVADEVERENAALTRDEP